MGRQAGYKGNMQDQKRFLMNFVISKAKIPYFKVCHLEQVTVPCGAINVFYFYTSKQSY